MNSEISLPIELVEPILIHLLRHFTLPVAHDSSTPIHPPLNALSRTLVPDVTRAAVAKLWWYSIDDIPPSATSWLLPMLLDLEQSHGRPLVYSVAGFGKAARRGDFDTMDAWIDAGLLEDPKGNVLSGGPDGNGMSLHNARLDGAEGEHMIQVYRWWSERGLPWGDQEAIETDLMLASSSYTVDEDTCIQALHWWRAQEQLMVTAAPAHALVAASRRGYTRVLDWWWAHFASSFQCTTDVMDAAVEGGGHLRVLEWWITKFPLNAPLGVNGNRFQAAVLKNVADLASKHGHEHILKWWFDHIAGFSKSYHKRTQAAMDHAAAQGHVAVLDFWLACSVHANPHRRIALKFSRAVDWATAAGQIQALEWFAAHKNVAPPPPGNPCPLFHWPESHARSISLQCLDWRLAHGLPTRFSPEGMAMLSKDGRLDVLEWVASNGIEYQVDGQALADASKEGHVAVLDWWFQRMGRDWLQTQLTATMPVTAHLSVLKWWAEKWAQLCSDARPDKVAKDRGSLTRDAFVSRCIDLCAAKGDYATMEECLKTFSRPTRRALNLTRLRYRLDQVQFGIIEFLIKHDLLPAAKSERHVLLADSIGQEELSRLVATDGGLPLVDWILTNYQLNERDRSHVFALTPGDLGAAQERGDLGLCRWVKRHQVAIRAFGVDGE